MVGCKFWILFSSFFPKFSAWLAFIWAEEEVDALGSFGFMTGWLGKVPFSRWLSWLPIWLIWTSSRATDWFVVITVWLTVWTVWAREARFLSKVLIFWSLENPGGGFAGIWKFWGVGANCWFIIGCWFGKGPVLGLWNCEPFGWFGPPWKFPWAQEKFGWFFHPGL